MPVVARADLSLEFANEANTLVFSTGYLFKAPPFSWWLSLSNVWYLTLVLLSFVSSWTDRFVYRHVWVCFLSFNAYTYEHTHIDIHLWSVNEIDAWAALTRQSESITPRKGEEKHNQRLSCAWNLEYRWGTEANHQLVSSRRERTISLPMITFYNLIASDDRWLWLETVTLVEFLWSSMGIDVLMFISAR